jgi:hypothetical protein
MADNIVATYLRADDATRAAGEAWYRIAGEFAVALGDRHDISPRKVAAMIAITSPRCSWEQNLARTEAFLRDRSTLGLFGWQIPRLYDVLAAGGDTEVDSLVRGPKVSRFYRNITGFVTPVTVDIWAVRVALGWLGANDATYKAAVGTPTRYELIEQAYVLAAVRLGSYPAWVQAVTWLQVRDIESGNVGSDPIDLPDNII